MNFSISDVPFSRYGSWLSFSFVKGAFAERTGTEGLVFRTVRDCRFHREMFSIDLIRDGEIVDCEIVASPERISLVAGESRVDICMPTPKTVRFLGSGIGLRMTAQPEKGGDYIIPYNGNQYVINSFGAGLRLAVTPLKGNIGIDAPWKIHRVERFLLDFLPDEDNGFDVVLEEYKNRWPGSTYTSSFAQDVESVRNEYENWLALQPVVPEEFVDTRELAAYLNWSCMVNPEDQIKRPSMFMSKNWMTNVWSWDHCFNAIALSYHDRNTAFDQFMTLFDHQDSEGAIPDSINNLKPVWNFLKPPIHGWALKKMMDKGAIDEAQLEEVYLPLCRWTEWWFNARDYDMDGIPQYDHGNDSGWDNCTLFTLRPPVESPDLSTFLIIQMEVLAEVAGKIGRENDAVDWKKRSEDLLNLLLEHSLDGDRIRTLQSGTHEVVPNHCLLEFMPLLLGNRLPESIKRKTVEDLKSGSYITEWGLATESTASEQYVSDGYWLGPIWAPSTMLMIEGLWNCGETELAADLAKKFAGMCKHSGFAENFDACTGAGLRDLAYTWTSSVFLILCTEYLMGD